MLLIYFIFVPDQRTFFPRVLISRFDDQFLSITELSKAVRDSLYILLKSNIFPDLHLIDGKQHKEEDNPEIRVDFLHHNYNTPL